MYQPSKELTNVPNLVEIPKWKWLADAIREGSRKTKQAFGTFFTTAPSKTVVEACALGAAALALYPDMVPKSAILKLEQRTREQSYIEGGALWNEILSWNDDHHLSREIIADKVEKYVLTE